MGRGRSQGFLCLEDIIQEARMSPHCSIGDKHAGWPRHRMTEYPGGVPFSEAFVRALFSAKSLLWLCSVRYLREWTLAVSHLPHSLLLTSFIRDVPIRSWQVIAFFYILILFFGGNKIPYYGNHKQNWVMHMWIHVSNGCNNKAKKKTKQSSWKHSS